MSSTTSASAIAWRGKTLFRCIIEYGGDNSDWAVGMTDDLDKTIYKTHDISPTDSDHAYLQCSSPIEAREEKQHFLEIGCCDDGTHGDAPSFVYIYPIPHKTIR